MGRTINGKPNLIYFADNGERLFAADREKNDRVEAYDLATHFLAEGDHGMTFNYPQNGPDGVVLYNDTEEFIHILHLSRLRQAGLLRPTPNP